MADRFRDSVVAELHALAQQALLNAKVGEAEEQVLLLFYDDKQKVRLAKVPKFHIFGRLCDGKKEDSWPKIMKQGHPRAIDAEGSWSDSRCSAEHAWKSNQDICRLRRDVRTHSQGARCPSSGSSECCVAFARLDCSDAAMARPRRLDRRRNRRHLEAYRTRNLASASVGLNLTALSSAMDDCFQDAMPPGRGTPP